MDGILANFIGSAELPLYLLLPRLVLSLGSIVILLGWFQWIFQSWKNGKSSPAGQQLLLAAVSGTASGIGVIMLQISSTFSPFIALLCIAGTTCIAYILSQAKPPIAIWCWAGILSVVQTWAFFLTGHLCEFAGLQYTAGFVGFEEFSLIRSGLFVAIDTFGGMSIVILSVIGIPAIGFCFEAGKRNDNRNKGRTARDRSLSKSSGRSSSFYSKNVRFMVLFFGFSRAFAAFCATTSAAIQKRHLYAWALFAPKFAFEVFFLISTDVILLLLAYLIRF